MKENATLTPFENTTLHQKLQTLNIRDSYWYHGSLKKAHTMLSLMDKN